MNDVYVIGHKTPDTDSVCSAIVYAGLKGYNPAIAGKINEETQYVLDYFKISVPEVLENATGKTVILVDHNEVSQRVDGVEKILEIIDHHKLNFNYSEPIFVHIEPLGSTATIIAKLFPRKIKTNKTYAGLLLAAILSDTVIFKSPITTKEDKKIAKKLARIAEIDDIIKFGITLKKTKASIKGKPIQEVIHSDFKDYEFKGKKVGIGQVEIVDLEEIQEREEEILNYLSHIKNTMGYDLVIFMATDIIKEGTMFYYSGNPKTIEKAFNVKVSGSRVWLPGVLSRKKQVVPFVEKAYLEDKSSTS